MLSQLQRLEGFYFVAREGGYAAAARAFPRPITQPAVYQQVRRLEEELEVDLVERVAHRRVRLTAAGERLYAFCRPFFDELPVVVRALRTDAEQQRLKVEAAGLVLRQLLPPWIRRLRRERADLRLELAELDVPDFERLRRGDIDLIVDFLPDVPEDIETMEVAIARPFVVVARDHPLAKSVDFDPSLLRDTPFVSYHPSLYHHGLQMAAVTKHIGPPPQVVAASSVDVILSFVAAGLGYSIVPWLEERGPRVKGVVAIEPAGHEQLYPIVAAWSGQSPVASTLRGVVALLE